MIPVFKPFVNRPDMQSVLNALVADDLEPAVLKDQFVSLFAKSFSAKGGGAYRSMYWAVRLAFLSMELEEGDRIFISPLSHRVYGDAARDLGLELVYIDVKEEDGLINLDLLEEHLDKEPKVLVLNYSMGSIPDLKRILALNIPVIEDVTEALGAKWENTTLGTVGDLAVIRLEYKDIITSGGGAVLLCKSSALNKRLQEAEALFPRNIQLTDFNASLGINQFGNLEKYLQTRFQVGELYQQSLMKGAHKTFQRDPNINKVYFSYPVLLNTGKKKVMKYARKNGVETEDLYEDSLFNHHFHTDYPCPIAENILLRGILFPLYPGLKKEEISLISKVLATLP